MQTKWLNWTVGDRKQMGFEQSFELFHALWRADVAGKRVPKFGGGTRESPWTEPAAFISSSK